MKTNIETELTEQLAYFEFDFQGNDFDTARITLIPFKNILSYQIVDDWEGQKTLVITLSNITHSFPSIDIGFDTINNFIFWYKEYLKKTS